LLALITKAAKLLALAELSLAGILGGILAELIGLIALRAGYLAYFLTHVPGSLSDLLQLLDGIGLALGYLLQLLAVLLFLLLQPATNLFDLIDVIAQVINLLLELHNTLVHSMTSCKKYSRLKPRNILFQRLKHIH